MITEFMAIHEPYADWILSGAKTVETRYMRLSPKYMNKEIGIYVPERKKIVGVVRVVSQITYPNKRAFDADYSRHLVGEDSPFYPRKSGKKIGLVLEGARAIEPISPKGRPYGSTISKNPVPPKAVSKVACRGLAKRRKYKRGGTSVGVARGRDLCNRVNVSMRTIKRMSSYFARHRASRAENAKRKSDPTSRARIADDLWGGTAGMNWARTFKPR
ncbi:MAG: ASCH domain-containing protein [Actinobacteria bacterium]|nr:ASCH domain-containing protein [Actinomycetota bacterium]